MNKLSSCLFSAGSSSSRCSCSAVRFFRNEIIAATLHVGVEWLPVFETQTASCKIRCRILFLNLQWVCSFLCCCEGCEKWFFLYCIPFIILIKTLPITMTRHGCLGLDYLFNFHASYSTWTQKWIFRFVFGVCLPLLHALQDVSWSFEDPGSVVFVDDCLVTDVILVGLSVSNP